MSLFNSIWNWIVLQWHILRFILNFKVAEVGRLWDQILDPRTWISEQSLKYSIHQIIGCWGSLAKEFSKFQLDCKICSPMRPAFKVWTMLDIYDIYVPWQFISNMLKKGGITWLHLFLMSNHHFWNIESIDFQTWCCITLMDVFRFDNIEIRNTSCRVINSK